MRATLIDGAFQSLDFPDCPRGKVPLPVREPRAQPYLWRYAQIRRSVDNEFSDDLETALITAGYRPDQQRPTGGLAPAGAHLIDGEFQSDKYPTCPRGHVPLSVKDPTAQELLWLYAGDCEDAEERELARVLREALVKAGFLPRTDYRSLLATRLDRHALDAIVHALYPERGAAGVALHAGYA